MKRIELSIVFIILTINLCVAQKMGFTSDFTSPQQIRSYYANNISLLDPIEGEYDIEHTGEYITPFVHQYYPKLNYKLFIAGTNKAFKAYILYKGKFSESNYSFESIGETNAYRMFFYTSSARIFLQDNIRFNATIRLDHSSAKKYTGNNNLLASIQIPLYYDCIKVYPTATMYASVKKSVEEVNPKEWTGTGFALVNNYIVTNYHVVEDAKSISIQGINGNFNKKYVASVVATDKVNDLAILKVNGVNISNASIPYYVKTSTSEVGEEIFVLGYPLTSTMGDEIKLTTGVISSKSGFQGDVSQYQISAPIQPGNSGGPLFDSNGNIIGIVSAKHKEAENVGYAIKASYLRNLMESALSANILPRTNRISTQKLSGKVKSVKNFVYYIVCSSTPNTNTTFSHDSNSLNESINSADKTYNYPPVSSRYDKTLTLISVVLKSNETVLTISCKNDLAGGWMNIDRNAYIVANGNKYTLTRTEGIAYSPNYTYFSYQGESKTFKLHFQAIPKNTTSIDFIEDATSQWRLYGISLR